VAPDANFDDRITRADMLKQRRLLLGVTFVLAAIYFLNVEVGNSATFQGLVVTFDHPAAIILALWITWAWAWWRYWHYEREYSSDALLSDRLNIWQRRAEALLSAEIQLRVDRGDYNSQGLKPGDRIRAEPSTWREVDLRDSKEEWDFGSLEIWKVNEPIGGRKTGGTNVRLGASEVREIKRVTERELRIRYRHFADWKTLYYLLWLAPIAAAFHVAHLFIIRTTEHVPGYIPWGG